MFLSAGACVYGPLLAGRRCGWGSRRTALGMLLGGMVWLVTAASLALPLVLCPLSVYALLLLGRAVVLPLALAWGDWFSDWLMNFLGQGEAPDARQRHKQRL